LKIVSIIGLPVAAATYAGAVEWSLRHALAGGSHAVEAANTHVAALARTDAAFGTAMQAFDLICPDGMPLVWAINSKLPADEKLTDRVYGPTLMLEVLKATDGKSTTFKHFLLGGKQSTLDQLTSHFAKRFPSVAISGSHSPPFGEGPAEEFETIADKICLSGANLIWVGLGCPKQEHWIAANKHRLPPGVYFGIGAAFAFHAGEVKQAPPLVQRLGMEWAYRVAMEPRRLFKRYFTYNSLFLYHLFRDHLRR
jgi:N-acetylglucosaminyldiphosphoundecaprenol N-acetyl-beta-D-mannosaminyltransferase